MSISVLNTDAGLSGKTLVTAEGTATVTGAHTFDRDPSAPFAVTSGSAVVTNLDADKWDGQDLPADPGADRVLFWDDSAGALVYLTMGTGLTITGTTLDSGLNGVTSNGTEVTKITFPAVQVSDAGANVLDDYEEGTWTPADGSGAALSFSSVEGYYVKVGQLVTVGATFTFPSTADGTAITISGLPFTVQNTTNGVWVGTFYIGSGGGLGTALATDNGTTFTVRSVTDTAIVNSSASTRACRVTMTYRATA